MPSCCQSQFKGCCTIETVIFVSGILITAELSAQEHTVSLNSDIFWLNIQKNILVQYFCNSVGGC